MNQFHKISASGNDFILFDYLYTESLPEIEESFIRSLCTRRTGVGADGIIILTASDKADFQMHYYNSDGSRGEMCGNGARASFYYYARFNNYKEKEIKLLSDVGIQSGKCFENNDVSLLLQNISDEDIVDLSNYTLIGEPFYINTGVPHVVLFCTDLKQINIHEQGKLIREDKIFCEGTNVNFAQMKGGEIDLKTYERGVENETLSCGTGVAATAISNYRATGEVSCCINTAGGVFNVTVIDDDKLSVKMTSQVKYHFVGELD